MTDLAARVADPDDLRFLVMFAAVLMVGAGLAVAAGAQPFLHRIDRGFGFRWVKRQ
ncbi:hypothetical protein I3J27_21575 [Bradyrhizobium xenonodulans]|uniref:Uncharacterized protein n=1 Tax=Bradyrhizobium xenonodulans TaxID=2736875 RepID=A0ABY7MDK0_9BRAD|nr:hypothetical protein [Bradyrhizobium xenonodulans]WBL75626.1 hypothetical protein I3J27_21575 [Bradyrhizobium xenonodulans]